MRSIASSSAIRSTRMDTAPHDALVPNRFETLREAFGDVRPLIVPVDEDVRRLVALSDAARVQNGGILAFLLGPTGTGKTTSVFSAAANASDNFHSVVDVPRKIDLRAAAKWIQENVPPRTGEKSLLVLFDGREVTDDKIGLRQFMTTLNQILRERRDIVFCWPTLDEEWHSELRTVANKVGGASLSPKNADISIVGPAKSLWPRVLERVLLQRGKTPADVGITAEQVAASVASNETVGEFLRDVSGLIAARLSETRTIKNLPAVVFVVTSSGDVIGEANRIRRAGNQSLSPEPLLGHSPRSEAGKWWTARNASPLHHLAYIISLFEAKLVTVSASSVVHACSTCADEPLRRVVSEAGSRPDAGNAGRTIRASELYRLLVGEQTPEYTSGQKGARADSTVKAYAAVQALSSKRHKAINQAIVRLVAQHVPGFGVEEDDFEVDVGEGNLFVDAIQRGGTPPLFFEFHHLSAKHCNAASMSSYIMEKLRAYAWHYSLIPR